VRKNTANIFWTILDKKIKLVEVPKLKDFTSFYLELVAGIEPAISALPNMFTK